MPDDGDEKPLDKNSLEGFALAVASMHRLLTRLSRADPFKVADLGFAEWFGLNAVHSNGGLSNKELAKNLGITVQRAAQISEALKRAGLITITQSQIDSRMNSMSISASGLEKLDEINSRLAPLIREGLKGRANLLPQLNRLLRVMIQVVTIPQQETK